VAGCCVRRVSTADRLTRPGLAGRAAVYLGRDNSRAASFSQA
jgi:hypothetical protein